MGQAHRYFIQIQNTDAQINRHAKMLAVTGYTDLAPNRKAYRLGGNLSQCGPNGAGNRAFANVVGRNQSLSLRRHYRPFNDLFYGRNKFTAKVDGNRLNLLLVEQCLTQNLFFGSAVGHRHFQCGTSDIQAC